MSFTPIFFEGFETGGVERITSLGSTFFASSTVRAGANGSYSFGQGSTIQVSYIDIYEYQGSSNSNAKGVGFWFQWGSSAVANNFFFVRDASNNDKWRLQLNYSQGFTLWDSANTILGTTGAIGYESNEWHFIELWYEEGTNAAWELFIDGQSKNSGTGATFGTGNTARLAFPGFTSYTPLFDDIYVAECTTSADLLGDLDIFATTGGTSATTGGTALDAGTWQNVQEIPASDSNIASYNAPTGTVDVRYGPDTLAVQTNLTGSVTDIDDDPDSPDANWLTASGSSTARVTFPTPTGSPTTGAGLQNFRVLLRKNATGPSGSGSEAMVPTGLGGLDSNLDGTAATIDDDPQAPGGDWRNAASNNADSVCHATFNTPAVTPSGTQTFEIYARLTANGSTCSYSVDLYESGVLVTNVGTGSLTSTTGQLISHTWNASSLGTADGSAVECVFTVTKTGGPPASRTSGEVDAVRWTAAYTATETQPGYEVRLYENGSVVSAVTAATGTLTDAGGNTIVQLSWDAAELGTADGSLVECYVNQTSGSDRYIEIGAIEWNCKYPAAGSAESGWIQADTGTKAGPSGVTGLNTIVGLTTFIRTAYSGSGSTLTHSLYRGNSTDGVTELSLGNATASNANFFDTTASATIVPTTTEYSRAGFGHPAATDVDIDCAEVIAMVAHVPAGANELLAAAGSYTYTGSDAGLTHAAHLDAAAGSYALTGADAQFILGVTLNAEAGSYAYTGSAAEFSNDWVLASEAGAYTQTGGAADFQRALVGQVDPGSYTYTGFDVNLQVGKTLLANAGAYTLTGSDADFVTDYALLADAGAYTYTGFTAGLNLQGAKVLSAEAGAYTYTGSNANLLGQFYLATTIRGSESTHFTDAAVDPTKQWTNAANAQDGSTSTYAYTATEGYVNTNTSSKDFVQLGQLIYAGTIILSDPVFPVNTEATHIERVRVRAYISATGTGTPTMQITARAPGSDQLSWFAWTDQWNETQTTPGWTNWHDIAAPFGGWGDYTSGTHDLIRLYFCGQDDTGTLTEARVYTAEVEVVYSDASYSASMVAARQKAALIRPFDAGAYSYTGSDAAFSTTFTLAADAGSYALTGSDAAFQRDLVVQAAAGSYTYTGSDTILSYSFVGGIAADPGSYTYTGSDAEFKRQLVLSASSAAYAATGEPVAFTVNTVAGAESGSYTVSGADAAFALHRSLPVELGSYALTGADADFSTTTTLSLDAGSYVLTGASASLNVAGSATRRVIVIG